MTHLRFSTFAALLLLFAPAISKAQIGVGYLLLLPPDQVAAGSNLTYSLTISNTTGTTLSPASAAFVFSSGFEVVGNSGAVRTNNTLTFNLPSLGPGQTNLPLLTVRPTSSGSFRLDMTIRAGSFVLTTNDTVNVVTSGDLGISLKTPTAVIVGDTASYAVTITNAGSNAVSGIIITNNLPSGASFTTVSPTNGFPTSAGGSLIITGATLAAFSSFTYNLFVQPTATGQLNVASSISSRGFQDTNSLNNNATGILTVIQPDTNQLAATFSNQVLDRQTGLFVQTVTLVNTSATTVASARLIVVGLASSNKLYNAVGTNMGNPFVVYPNAITNGQTVDFLLEFYYPSRIPQTNLTYIAYGVPMPNLNTTTNGTGITLELIDVSANRVLLEFPSTPGKTYRIIYSSDPAFSNPLMAEPPVVANADKTQWIDEGPPKTISLPGNSGSRFYKVIQQ